MPNDAPKTMGTLVQVTAFVDASHAADKKTRQSHTGYIIFANRAPMIWYSKQQATVESITFSSYFRETKDVYGTYYWSKV